MRCSICTEPEMLLNIHDGKRYPYQPHEGIKSLTCSRCVQRMLKRKEKKEEPKPEI